MNAKKQYKKLTAMVNKTGMSKKFVKIALYAVQNEITDTQTGGQIPVEDQAVLAYAISYSMALGEQMTKNKYLIRGSLVGIAVTAAFFKIREIFKEEEKESN